MSNVAVLLKWVVSKFFHIALVILVLVYLWWFRLVPVLYARDGGANLAGLSLLVLYAVIIGARAFTRHRHTLHLILSSTAVLFLGLVGLIVGIDLPRLEYHAECAGATYYITSNSRFPDPGRIYQFTKWQGLTFFKSFYLRYEHFPLRLICDNKMSELGVAEVTSIGEHLIYTDGEKARVYDIEMQVDGHNYYTTSDCASWRQDNPAECSEYDYGLYQCALDNTSCIALPFRYVGGYAFDAELIRNQATGGLDLYFEMGSDTRRQVLVYSYSEHPQCHVSGCSLLSGP